jgi:hypothetical protein
LDACPIALAIKRQGLMVAPSVTRFDVVDVASPATNLAYVPLPVRASKFVRAFDRGSAAAGPFNFFLEMSE